MNKLILLICGFILQITVVFSQNISVLTQHGDNRRTGWNNRETILTTSNLNQASFGKSYSMPVDDQIYAQPLVVSNLNIGGANHNTVFVATVNNTVYAFDADKAGTFWFKNYTVGGMRVPQNKDMTGACGGNYNDFSGNIGIIGTPVIDSARSTMYFVARSTDSPVGSWGMGNFFEYLHAIDITTGNERANSPVRINASISGIGEGSVNGMLDFNPQHENQRAGLLLVNGIVYLTFAGHCDWSPYHGWILGYDEISLQQKFIFNTSPDGHAGGIWMSGAGPSADENGNIYAAVGNGSISTNTGNPRNYGESAIKLFPTGNMLGVSSFFTAKNFTDLNNADLDFGSTQILLVPSSSVEIAGSKDGNIYVMNGNSLGGYNAATNNVLQTINLGSGKTLRSSFSYFKGMTKEWLYTWSENAALKAFPFLRNTSTFDQASVVIGTAQGPTGNNGTLLSVSSNGSKDGTGILWATHAVTGDANQSTRPGILRAFDANDVTKELWNSNQKPGDNIGNYAKFVCPTIANGKVYIATFSNQLLVYGKTDTTIVAQCTGIVDLAKGKNAFASSIESSLLPAINAADSNLSTRWASLQGADPQSIYVDLGNRYDVCKVILNWEAAYAKDFQLQVSDDAVNWTTVKSISGNTFLQNILYVKGTGRYIRMFGTARGTTYGYSLYEFQVFGTTNNSCAPPASILTSGISRTGATISWNQVPGINSYQLNYKTVGALGFTSLNVTGSRVTLQNLVCGTDYLLNVQAVCANGSLSLVSANQAFSTLICDGSCGFLPTRWSNQDVGKTAITGSSCFRTGAFTLKASGTDVWNTADGFQFAYKTFNGSGRVSVRVDSIIAGNLWAKAGIMFRESLDSGSRHVIMAMTPGSANGAAFQFRQSTGGNSSNTNVPGFNLPYFVRVVKNGTTYSGYISADSITWKQVGTTVDLGFGGQPLLAGIFLSSHDNSSLGKAVFSHVPIIFSADTGASNTNCPPVNIALNRPAASSSTSSTDKAIYEFKAFDGDTTSSWVSRPGIDPQWIYTDLGKNYQLCQVSIQWGTQFAQNYQIQVSDDASTWKTVQSVTGNRSRLNIINFNSTTQGRFLRVYGTGRATTLGYAIQEMQVRGTALPNQPFNIALNKNVFSSSNENSLLLPGNIVDGLGSSRWASQLNVDTSWVYIDLGAIFILNKVMLDWEVALGRDFQIQVSSDLVIWNTLQTIVGNTLFTNVINLNGSGRYVRMFGTKRGYPAGYSLYEFEVYGQPQTALRLAGSISQSQLKIYPVPAANYITIETQNLIIGDISLINLSTNLPNKLLFVSRSALKAVININALNTGFYILEINTIKDKLSKIISIKK